MQTDRPVPASATSQMQQNCNRLSHITQRLYELNSRVGNNQPEAGTEVAPPQDDPETLRAYIAQANRTIDSIIRQIDLLEESI